ncbi:MAG: ComEC/Rec2 family competence protein [Bacteroidales bacterium]|nr:ComEC/Rec2 family competence protein [Bacteroidales bacterium]
MEVERDLAGIAIPFTAGIGLAFLLIPLSSASTALVFAVILSGLILLMHPVHLRMPEVSVRLSICIVMTAAGILCGLTSTFLSTSRISGGVITDFALSSGNVIGQMIDSIGFSNSDTNAVIKALLIGDRADIPFYITEAFRESGASHILALSGFHLGIVYGIVTSMLSILGNRPAIRYARSFLTILLCGFYTLATGAGASIVRAFIFILLGEAARLTGRYRSTASVLMAALLIHLTIDPQSIREVGFQLSYAAMAGIAFIFPWLRSFWPEESDNVEEDNQSHKRKHSASRRPRPLKWVWNSAAMSISCQLTTGPLAYLYFGTFPTHFLLTNLIALPLAGLLIPFALLTVSLSALDSCPDMLLRVTETLVVALTDSLSIIAGM